MKTMKLTVQAKDIRFTKEDAYIRYIQDKNMYSIKKDMKYLTKKHLKLPMFLYNL